ncbi:MAG: outer membrane lipoprotein carrier protein LolA [bacterium]|nr:outer membrane lipoprotein carrier protein LolA [bacterium]
MSKTFFIILFFFNLVLLSTANSNQNHSIKNLLTKIDSRMSSTKSIQCDFIQKKKLSILNKPIIMTGKIYIQKPDRFAWHSFKPIRYSFIVSGDSLKQWDEDSNKIVSINLKKKPALKVIINQMNIWFSGNYIKQLNNYTITIQSRKPLILKFIPNSKEISSKFIKSITVTFSTDLKHISSIYIMEKNNDSMEIKFNKIIINSTIPEKMWNIFNG